MIRRLGLCVVVLIGCARPEDQKTGSVEKADFARERNDLPAELRVHLDSGNAYYKSKQYQEALMHYRAAAEIKNDEVAPWFGIYMTQIALKNAPAADSALARARKLAPGATILR
jgi:tetratricopeptide (TPR) repeat protein